MRIKNNNSYFKPANEFDISILPEKILVSKKNLMKKEGKPSTEEKRRMHDPRYRNRYSDNKKLEVACCFAVCGNSRTASEITKVPEATIRTWKQQEWWSEIISRIHAEEDEELDTKLTKLVNKAVDYVNDRLDNGDWLYNAKSDKLIRKPVGAKDLAIVTAITLDKRQLLRGQPTSRVEKVSQDERLLQLADKFKKFSAAKDITYEAELVEEVIEEELEEIEEELPTINEMFREEEI
jgi:hypothetical protein